MKQHPTPEDLHGEWMNDTMLRQIGIQAARTAVGPADVVAFLFACCAHILQHEGITEAQLLTMVKAQSPLSHEEPEVKQ